ncbi:centrosomal protein of 19 kDa [Lates japonicus]|uniref:Centrosomal protein of 19 kDa n=1 Tax=Lates japonicus TaxID=270547 RepID=A0AAD3N1E3_LATJO|nr:centrosomal protein of 19 kDa [Lates japonicus]
MRKRIYCASFSKYSGFSLEHSWPPFRLDPDEPQQTGRRRLARKKGQMDELFEKNLGRKNDHDFVYDLEVDSKPTAKKSAVGWPSLMMDFKTDLNPFPNL